MEHGRPTVGYCYVCSGTNVQKLCRTGRQQLLSCIKTLGSSWEPGTQVLQQVPILEFPRCGFECQTRYI